VNKPADEGRTEPIWDLGDLYSSTDAWTTERDKLRAAVQTLDRLKGTLGKSANDMLAARPLHCRVKAGGSDYRYVRYKKAGLDMASPVPYQALVPRMNRITDDIDRLLAEK
jgi:oligoendopeptidase F